MRPIAALGRTTIRAFIFPGQGSQVIGMGRGLADASPVARAVFEEVDEALGQKLSRLMWEGPEVELTLTANAQPAIMAVGIAALRVLEAEAGMLLADKASYVAGHSLGEYTALCAARALPLAATARLLRVRGDAMQAAVPAGEGAMAALLGLGFDDVVAIAAEACTATELVQAANDNANGQVVVSGHTPAVARAMALARTRGARHSVLLPVSAPFHCALMQPAAEAMAAALADAPLVAPVVPLIANVTAAPVHEVDAIRALLVAQVTGTVRWRESVLAMADLGVTTLVELGGKVLGPMVRRITPDMKMLTAADMAGVEALAKEL
ncbi:[acyl-carrier-protein] S-malonyltransferase [Polymorphobacter multimanifer]|uniref:Malonyl CoA-acyl carrier protein transacylase n=1 Tax=Polymorphobacter multimanifer TaxID=1070431 RepID=A0A841L7W2_9SPHN|nr:ACP S-malonyltransferase [Polymorphobacter multimanifer]MBB6227671.1 [acyl-carrier-protein] S-malonyltransferase [Polymorphobacter multimanifer]